MRVDLDARADIFALGCVLFECATGRPAFWGPNAVAVLAKLLLEGAPRARQLEPWIASTLDDLLSRMMSKEPALRPRDGGALRRALEATDDTLGSSSGSGLAGREQRIVTIVLGRGLEGELDGALRLADGASLMEFRGDDPVTRAAAWSLGLARRFPRASMAIATGRVGDEQSGAYGPIIDRVATLSPPSGIAIDASSSALLGDRFTVIDGLLIGTSVAGGAPRTLLGKRTPFVGCNKEIALLRATLEECVMEPVARAVLVTGPAGSGKSRLTYELLSSLDASCTVLIARGAPVGAGSTLGIARQLVRAAAGLSDADSATSQHEVLVRYLDRFFSGDALRRHSELLGELVGAPTAQPSAELRAARAHARLMANGLSQSFRDWMTAIAELGPTLLVVEDLHWGDGSSVAYLDDALRANVARPLMVLALARPEVHELFPGLWSHANTQEIKLTQLTRRAAERLVRSVLEDVGDPALARVIDNAAGNAFYLEELIRHVSERGVDSLPDTVLSIAETRLARLDPEARRLLRVASVFGETFWEPALGALLGADARAPEVLARLHEAEVVGPTSGRKLAGEHRFRHGLLRDAAYATLADADRAALHLAAAEWLESVGEHDALVLAEHFERASHGARAATCFLRAAKHAFDSWNVTVSDSLADRGIRCGAVGEELGELLLTLAGSAVVRGDHVEASRRAKAAFELLPPRLPSFYLAAANALSSGAYIGDLELAPRIIQTLLTTVPEGPPTGPYGAALRLASDILDSVGQAESTELMLDRAEALVATTVAPDPSFVASVLYARTAASMRRDDDVGRVRERVAQGTELAARAGDAVTISLFKFGRGLLDAEIGSLDEARAAFESTLREVAAAPLFSAWCSIHLGWCDFCAGRYPEALAHARRAFERDPHHAYALAAMAHLAGGARTEAERASAQSLERIEETHVTPYVVALAHAVAARVALSAGRHEEAEHCSERAGTPTLCAPFLRSFIARTHIEVSLAVGRDARPLIEAAAARLERHGHSLDDVRRASLFALPDHARILELAQRP